MHFMPHLLIICIPLLCLVNGKPTNKPFRLTDGQNGHKSIPYRSPAEQCFSNGTDEAKKSLGLEFRLPPVVGHCDDGILICFPGSLQSPPDDLKIQVKGRFIVGNENQETQIAKECAEKMTKDGISVGKIYRRGIKVYTKPASGSNGPQMRSTKLETAISNQTYNIGANQFKILFDMQQGSDDSFTKIPPLDEELSFLSDNRDLQTEFLDTLPKGAFLAEYAGLWLLGMDMMPMMGQQMIKLYINRGCNCTMEAWFIQPSDSFKPTNPEMPTVGPLSTNQSFPISPVEPLSTNQSFPISLIDGKECTINITALTDANIKSITVELFRANKRKSVMSFNLDTNKNLDVNTTGRKVRGVKGTRLSGGSYVLNLEIVLQMFWYLIKINGAQLGGKFWQKEWWKELPKNINLIRVQGQMMLLDDPKVTQKEHQTDGIPLPFTKRIKGFFEGSTFVFRVQMRQNGNFKLTFSNDGQFNESVGQTAFVVEIGRTKAELSVFYEGKWHEEEKRTNTTYNIGTGFELSVNISKEFYGVKLNKDELFPANYANAMPFCVIKHAQADGDAVLLNKPKLKVPSKPPTRKSGVFTKALDKRINTNDKIVIIGKNLSPDTPLQVKFTHNAPECSKIYDVLYTLKMFSRKGTECWRNREKEERHSDEPTLQLEDIVAKGGADFRLTIVIRGNKFFGTIGDRQETLHLICEFPPRNGKSDTMERIDHVQIVVANTTGIIAVNHEAAPPRPLPPPHPSPRVPPPHSPPPPPVPPAN